MFDRIPVSLLSAQLALVVVVLLGAVLWPPAQGAMLLLPLTRTAAADTARLAIGAEARILARGPVTGSLVVEGERGRLSPLLARGVLVMAAAPAGCTAGLIGTPA